MRRLFSWFIGLPLVVLMIAFAIANRSHVAVSFDPLSQSDPMFALNIPLWVLFYAGILLGLIVGWFAAWFGQAKWRRSSRKAESDLSVARMENERLKRQAATTDLVPVDH